MSRVRVLSARDLERVLPLPSAIAAMEQAFALAPGSLDSPPRGHLSIPESKATFLWMPASSSAIAEFGTKLVGVFPHNSPKGLDPIQAVYLLFSRNDGRLLAMMDGRYLTAVRTAATTAVATRKMSRDGPARLALFGTGTQARFHLSALAEVRELTEVRVCGSSPKKSEDFVELVQPQYRFTIRATTADRAVESADIVCTCTDSAVPVFPGRLLPRGCHVSAIGSFQPQTRELDDDVFEDARVVVDTLAGAMAEAGDVLIPLRSGRLRREQVLGELGQLLRGEIAGRTSPEDRTVFKSVGWAIEDLAAGSRAYQNALDHGIGDEVDL